MDLIESTTYFNIGQTGVYALYALMHLLCRIEKLHFG